MSEAAEANTTNVVHLPTAAITPPPRLRAKSRARREMIRRGEVIDLLPLIWAKEPNNSDCRPTASDMIWIQVSEQEWRRLEEAVRILETLGRR